MTQLTKFPSGSMRELFTLSVPLMLSALSGNLMVVFDRLVLSHYSLEAMNAAAAAGMMAMIFIYGAIGIVSIAEVFVGQFNGSKQYEKVAKPVWQMVWFSLFLSIVYYPLSYFGAPYLLTDYYYFEYGFPYFHTLLLFASLFPLQVAIASFFIGLGKVKLVTICTILGNVLNVLLDLLLVFGWEPIFPAMGTKGAAIATGISQGIQVLILFIFFVNRKNRNQYKTHVCSFNFTLFKKCLRVGVPSAAGHMFEIAAWAVITAYMATLGTLYLTVVTMGQTFYSLVAFSMEGLQKGVAAVASNCIGSGSWDKIKDSWNSAVKLLLLFALFLSLLLIFYPGVVLDVFLSHADNTQDLKQLYPLLRVVSISIWIYLILDGLTWISAGFLTADGDTVFIMVLNALSSWIFAILPMYVSIEFFHISPAYIWININFYALVNAICFYWRFRIRLKKQEQRLL